MKSDYSKESITEFLSRKYGEDIRLFPIKEGQESQAYWFSRGGREYVVRINSNMEGFKKDKYASRGCWNRQLWRHALLLHQRKSGRDYIWGLRWRNGCATARRYYGCNRSNIANRYIRHFRLRRVWQRYGKRSVLQLERISCGGIRERLDGGKQELC